MKQLRYIDWKYNRKYGNSSWQYRRYWDAKGDSWYDMFKSCYRTLCFNSQNSLEARRADRLIYKDIQKKNWNSDKYPKLYKKFIDNTTIEFKILKKDKWRV
jgi:hypothetical protein